MKENRERKLSNQLPTFISECILWVVCLGFVGLLFYNFVPGRNYLTGHIYFNIEGNLVNLVLTILSCSVAMAGGIALVIIAIVGRYKDKIMTPHHISFISGICSASLGLVLLCLLLFVQI